MSNNLPNSNVATGGEDPDRVVEWRGWKVDKYGITAPEDNPEYDVKKKKYIKPKKSAVSPTKIDTKSGKGVPGGFEASSVKTPEAAASKASSNMAAIQAKSAALAAFSPPGASAAQSKLTKLMAKQKQKQLDALSAPKFNSSVKLPSPPEPPDMPDFDALGIPKIPELPGGIPKIPGLGGFIAGGLTIGAGAAAAASLSGTSGTSGTSLSSATGTTGTSGISGTTGTSLSSATGTEKLKTSDPTTEKTGSLPVLPGSGKSDTHNITVTIYKADI